MLESNDHDSNPYIALDVSSQGMNESPMPTAQPRSQTLGIVLSVIGGSVTAVSVFCLTFFVTCLGAFSARGGPSLGFESIVAISILTAVIAAILASIGILKLVRLLQR